MLIFEFEFGIFLWFYVFTFILVSSRESHLLISWCTASKCDMTGNDNDRGRSRRPGVEDRG
jgi:hypothetical protein